MSIFILSSDPAGVCCDCTTRANPCDMCTPTPISGCGCFLFIPPLNLGGLSEYSSITVAEQAITDLTADCLMFCYTQAVDSSIIPLDTKSMSPPPSPREAAFSLGSSSRPTANAIFSLSLGVGVLLVAGSVSTASVGTPTDPAYVYASLYTCDGILVSTQSVTGGNYFAAGSILFNIDTEGEYLLVMGGVIRAGGISNCSYNGNIEVDFTTVADNLIINPVVARYNASGTTRKLFACPKFFLPPFTEFTHALYTNLAVAQSDMSSNRVSNCVGYSQTQSSDIINFTATNLTTSLKLQGTAKGTTFLDFARIYMAGNMNLKSGSILSAFVSSATSGGGPVGIGMTIYYQDGTVVGSIAVSYFGPTTYTFNIPYDGYYIFDCIFTAAAIPPSIQNVSATVTFSSNMAATVNEMQALYDVELDCAGRVDCS